MAQITDIFVSSEERLVAILGNSAAQAFFSTGTVGSGFIVLSDRRVYFRGRCLHRAGKRFSYIHEDRTVDVENVTGTGFVYINHIWMKVLAIILAAYSAVCLVACVAEFNVVGLVLFIAVALLSLFFFLRYRATRANIFEIAFAGGGIALDVRWFKSEEAEHFQKCIKLAGDELKRKEKMYGHATGAATELAHLAELVEKGLLSPEEFEAQKRKLLY